MIARTASSRTKLLKLKIVLLETDPRVWRQVCVSENATLGDLHLVIQAVMPWYDYHMHEFLVGDRHYGVPNPDFDMAVYPMHDEEDLPLTEAFVGDRKRITYIYDLGDGWQHSVQLEGEVIPESPIVYPLCIDGANACPPEDSGSLFGYYEKLRILADTTHPMYAQTVEWMPTDFDPSRFDIDKANELLRYNAQDDEGS